MPSGRRNRSLLGSLTVLAFRLRQPLEGLEEGAVVAVVAVVAGAGIQKTVQVLQRKG